MSGGAGGPSCGDQPIGHLRYPVDLADFGKIADGHGGRGHLGGRHSGEGLYTPEWSARTYAALLDRASALLSRGESVVLDATWSDAGQREAALRMAERTSADLVALHCRAPGEVSAARLSTRAPGASDATPEAAKAMAAAEPPSRRAAESPWEEAVPIDTGGPLDAAVVRATAAVRPYGSGQARPSAALTRSRTEQRGEPVVPARSQDG